MAPVVPIAASKRPTDLNNTYPKALVGVLLFRSIFEMSFSHLQLFSEMFLAPYFNGFEESV